MEVHKIRVTPPSSQMNLSIFFIPKQLQSKNAHPYCCSKERFFFLLMAFLWRFSIYLPSSRNFLPGNLQLLTLSDLSHHSFLFATPWASMGCWKRRVHRVSPESVEDAKVEVGAAVPDRPPTVPVDRVKEIFLSARERQEEAW